MKSAVKARRTPRASALDASASAPARHLPARRWQPGALHWLTGVAHIGAAAAAVAQPAAWPWALGAIGANHAVNLAFGLSPATGVLGPVISTLPAASAARAEIALTFDDGPDGEITPRVLDLLDSAGARATFFCVGERARSAPVLVREMVARGHAVENHSFAHSLVFGFYGVGRLVRDISAAQDTLADITGTAPRFFRAPFGIRTPLTEPALAQLGLTCVAWNIRSFDSVDRNSARVVARITRKLAPGAIVLMHDGTQTRRRSEVPAVLAALPEVLRQIGCIGARCISLRSAFAA